MAYRGGPGLGLREIFELAQGMAVDMDKFAAKVEELIELCLSEYKLKKDPQTGEPVYKEVDKRKQPVFEEVTMDDMMRAYYTLAIRGEHLRRNVNAALLLKIRKVIAATRDFENRHTKGKEIVKEIQDGKEVLVEKIIMVPTAKERAKIAKDWVRNWMLILIQRTYPNVLRLSPGLSSEHMEKMAVARERNNPETTLEKMFGRE